MKTEQLTISVDGQDHVVLFRPHTSDLSVVKQVFENQEYNTDRMVRGDDVRAAYEKILRHGNIPVILDLGANIGASSLYFNLITNFNIS